MVAYSFKDQFIDPIQSGEKHQTIRALRKTRHAMPGDRIQLYAKLRTKKCYKIIDDPICCERHNIHLHIGLKGFEKIQVGKLCLPSPLHQRFAQEDGFECISDMVGFWKDSHGTGPFTGVMIVWGKSSFWKEVSL